MTDPMGAHCPTCGRYLGVHGCKPERCNNPEGPAELERLRAEQEANPLARYALSYGLANVEIREIIAGTWAKPCLGTQAGPCPDNELTKNEHGRCRDCDIEYSIEAQCCEACGWWHNALAGDGAHVRSLACPFVAL